MSLTLTSPLTLDESVQENEPVDIYYAENNARLTVRTTDSSITIAAADVWSSGEEATVTLTYPDLNLNTDAMLRTSRSNDELRPDDNNRQSDND